METKYICHICNKYYKSNSSLWNHNNRYHNDDYAPKCPESDCDCPKMPQNTLNSNHNDINIKNNKICMYCNYKFARSNGLKRHLDSNRCKMKHDHDKITSLQNEIDQLKTAILEIKLDKNSSLIHNNNATLNNSLQTNNVLIQLGKENIIDVMPKSDQIKILNTCYNSLYRLIKEIHCSDKYPQFKNLAITNLSDNYGHRYDDKLKCFVKCHKNELIETLIDNRIVDIEDILNANIDKISEEKAKKLIILIEEITEKRGCYKNKKEQIKLLIYNECKIKF